MLRVAWVRGAFINNFEGQNYIFNDSNVLIKGIGSKRPIHEKLPFETMKFYSLADMHNPVVDAISRRLLGDSQILYNLESVAGDFDIFHTADPHYYYSYQLARLRRKNKIKKLIITSWEVVPNNNESIAAKKRIKYYVLDSVDHAVCYTEKAKNVLVEEGVPANKISVVQLGVDLNKFNHNKKISHSNVKILFVGRLVEEKGVMEGLEAVIRLISRVPTKIEFQIVGSGPLKARIFKRIKEAGINGSARVLALEYEDMYDAYHNCDILIAPSKITRTWQEQYGMVLVEAMASGLVVVSSNTGAIPEVVGNAGICLDNVSTSEICNVLEKLILDKNYRQSLQNKAVERARVRFDAAKTAKEIGKIYHKVWKT